MATKGACEALVTATPSMSNTTPNKIKTTNTESATQNVAPSIIVLETYVMAADKLSVKQNVIKAQRTGRFVFFFFAGAFSRLDLNVFLPIQ